MSKQTADLIKGIAIGVDVGGTKIRSGLVNHLGEVIGESYTVPTDGNDAPEAIFRRITDAISVILEKQKNRINEIIGIGLGVTGPLDIKNGVILECPQLPTLHYFPLKVKIKETFHLPVFMNNDANAMILGESLWGSGMGNKVVLGLTLGTGLGCAIVIDQHLQIGSRELAGEIWSSPYKDGIIEDSVSGRGVSAIFRRKTGKDLSSIEIATLAESGNQQAVTTWQEFGIALGFALSWSVNLIDPDIIVLGGSITHALPLFYDSMLTYLKKHACPPPAILPPILTANLGDEAGVIGAAGLVFTHQ